MNINDLIEHNIPDNNIRSITPEKLREVLKALNLGQFILPTIELEAHYLRSKINTNASYFSQPQLKVKVNAVNEQFKQFNPEIWLFRYKQKWTTRKKITESGVLTSSIRVKKTKWAHPTHLNGMKHISSAYYGGGDDFGVISSVYPEGRATEFSIPKYNDWFVLKGLQPCRWFTSENGVALKDNEPYLHLNVVRNATGMKGMTQRFRFAVVLDDPNNNTNYPKKIICPMSEELVLRVFPEKQSGYARFGYELNRFGKHCKIIE